VSAGRWGALATPALAILLPNWTSAQRPHRTGLWGEIGLGAAYARMACSGCAEVATAPGASSVLRIGGKLSERVLLGIESFGFIHEETLGSSLGDTSTVAETAMMAAVVLWFPWRSGVFLKGGLGVTHGQFTVVTAPSQADTTQGTGIGMTYGLGLDLPISRKLALTANAAAFIEAIGDLELPGRRVDDVIATMYHATIGLTFR
jgi:hypothetical protein